MYLSIRDDIVFAAGYPTLVDGLKDLKIKGVEIWYRPDDTITAPDRPQNAPGINVSTPEGRAELTAILTKYGIVISAFCMSNDFNADDKEFQFSWAVRAIRAAEALGIPAIRIDAAMSGEHTLPEEERRQLVVSSLRRILDATSDSTVELGIENHGYQGNDPEFLTQLMAEVGSNRLGLTLDSGNFYWRGWPLSQIYAIFERFAPVVKHTHIKNISYPVELREGPREIGYEYEKYAIPIHQGDIDHSRYIEILDKAGYERDICLEDESLGRYPIEERQAILRATSDYFRPLLVK